jgi:hypothetical protein
MRTPPAKTDITSDEEEYYVEPVDVPIHTAEHHFCDDMTCPCHEDSDNIGALGEAVQEGHATTEEADRIYRGKNV